MEVTCTCRSVVIGDLSLVHVVVGVNPMGQAADKLIEFHLFTVGG